MSSPFLPVLAPLLDDLVKHEGDPVVWAPDVRASDLRAALERGDPDVEKPCAALIRAAVRRYLEAPESRERAALVERVARELAESFTPYVAFVLACTVEPDDARRPARGATSAQQYAEAVARWALEEPERWRAFTRLAGQQHPGRSHVWAVLHAEAADALPGRGARAAAVNPTARVS
jgi:hypothetical protein